MTVVDNSMQESALPVTRRFTGSRVRPELIRHSDGRLHRHALQICVRIVNGFQWTTDMQVHVYDTLW